MQEKLKEKLNSKAKQIQMALCRSHHTEIHTMPKDEFCKKYHVKPIIFEG